MEGYEYSHFGDAVVQSPFMWFAVALLAVLYYVTLPQGPTYGNFKREGGTILRWNPVHEVVDSGYKKIIKPTKKPIVVRWWAKDYVILPAKYLADLRTANWGHLHFFRNISDALFLDKTVGDMYTSPFAERMVDVVRKGLNPRLPQLTPVLLEEINYGFREELKRGNPTAKGTKVVAMKFFSSIVHRSATRVMIGTELCHQEEFLRQTTSLLESIFFTAIIAVNLPLGPLRGILTRLFTLPHKWKLDRCTKMLLPVVQARMKSRNSQSNGCTDVALGDGIEWTLDLTGKDPKYDTPEKITHELLHNLWAASSAPGGMMTEIVYQILTYPEYMDPLREEAKAAVQQHGWTEKMLSTLHLQDSFIREVNRLMPTGAITCSRTVVGEPFTFSDGLVLPVNTRFGFPIKAMQTDPDNFSCPEKFDGFRFAKKSSSETGVAEDSRRWSATAMSSTNLAWGYGNHMCPGRFFAVRGLKFILTKLLLEYEIGWDRKEGEGRPKCVNVEGQFVPNLTQTVYIKPISAL